MPNNIISWNALIVGYGNRGWGDEAVEMFEKMLQAGMIPNHVTFLVVFVCLPLFRFIRTWMGDF
ncbi:putative pentatricopeptide [Rosa chinensis]|uniref:Putative pentatricopeptide n=1 Tax=Rosa chinensis TaxID=74649 RepID=A0A2P6S4E2_ROSCH|nr:putative pentatricopeptide [Rosa chinensis]